MGWEMLNSPVNRVIYGHHLEYLIDRGHINLYFVNEDASILKRP